MKGTLAYFERCDFNRIASSQFFQNQADFSNDSGAIPRYICTNFLIHIL
jgi:hypothetical protein